MTMDFSRPALARMRQAMLLGLAHNALPKGRDALTTLSLVAARRRCDRLALPSSDSAIARAPDGIDRAGLLPEAARAALLRLFAGKDGKSSDSIAAATARVIKSSGLKVHPFDYARLEGFIAQFAGDMGPQERTWLTAVRPASKLALPSYDDAPVDEHNLAQAGKAQKLSFLRALRQRDPAKAVSLIKQVLPHESAGTRVELIGLLGIGLGDSDRSFLEEVVTDRAQSVREAALMLLARLPGTSAHDQKLAQLKDRIEAKKAGLLRRRVVFSLRSSPKPQTAFDPLQGLNESTEWVEGLPLAEIAGLFGVTVDELIAGSVESPVLGHLLLRQAVLEAGPVDLKTFAPLLAGDLGHLTLAILSDLLPRLAGEGRRALLALAFRPGGWSSLPSYPVFASLHAALGEALPHEIAAELLQSSPWREAMRGGNDDMRGRWAEALAPLIPRPLSERFLTDVETVSRRAALYHRFLLTLPETRT